MKVLLIDVNYKNSSTGALVESLHKSYLKKGIDSYVCYGRGKKIKEEHVYKFSYSIETLFHAFLTRIIGLTGYFSYFSTKNLIRKIKKIKPDIIHINELHAYFVNVKQLMRFLQKLECKIIFTLHCEFLYTGKCGHSFECNKWKEKCEKCPYLNNYPKSLFFDFTKKMFLDKKNSILQLKNVVITTPSNWLAHRAKSSFLSVFPIVVIENCVNTNIFKMVETKKNINFDRVILSVAPNLFSNEKGGKYIVELAEMNPNYLFICAGNNKIKQKLPTNLVLKGVVSDKNELVSLYNMADLFLICSKRETFSLTCAEAMCCGLPVVGFDSGAVLDTAPEPYGKFCKYGDVEKLNELIHIDISKITSNEISEYARKRFNPETMSNSFLKIYEK